MATPGQALDEFRELLAAEVREIPDGSNCASPVTTFFGWCAAWCAATICYVLYRLGIEHTRTYAVAELMRKAQAGEDGWSWWSTPQPGDAVCYDWRDGGIRTDHVGMVESVRDGGFVALEGNYRNRVARVVRNYNNVLGFARPSWDSSAGSTVAAGQLRVGSIGARVTELQKRLAELGYDPGPIDGDFGPQTDAAVRRFQSDNGLEVDGVVGPATTAALDGAGAPRPPTPMPAPSPEVPPFPGMARKGSRGEAVRQVQQRLVDRGWHLDVDGDFGPATDRTVRSYQSEKGLEVDGIVGPVTWHSMWTAPVT